MLSEPLTREQEVEREEEADQCMRNLKGPGPTVTPDLFIVSQHLSYQKHEIAALRAQLATMTAERDKLKGIVTGISEGQDPLVVLVEGMTHVMKIQQQLATAQARIEELNKELMQWKSGNLS